MVRSWWYFSEGTSRTTSHSSENSRADNLHIQPYALIRKKFTNLFIWLSTPLARCVNLKVRFWVSFVNKIYERLLVCSFTVPLFNKGIPVIACFLLNQNSADSVSSPIQNPTSDRTEISQVPSVHFVLWMTGTLLKSKAFGEEDSGETRNADTALKLFS